MCTCLCFTLPQKVASTSQCMMMGPWSKCRCFPKPIQLLCTNCNPLFPSTAIVAKRRWNKEGMKDGESDHTEEVVVQVPVNLEQMEWQYGARMAFVSKKTIDVDNVGLKKNRAGWYVSLACLQDFLMYFDDIMQFRNQ